MALFVCFVVKLRSVALRWGEGWGRAGGLGRGDRLEQGGRAVKNFGQIWRI